MKAGLLGKVQVFYIDCSSGGLPPSGEGGS